MSSVAITTISRCNLTKPPAASAKITDFEHIASYTWWNKTAPTISVPGSPPLWHPPSTTPRLEPDSGTVYIDQNAARCPSSPLEPLFRAALIENVNFSLDDVDLVTDRNNIRKLLRFAQASSDDHFRIRIEIVGETTALLTRVEPKTTLAVCRLISKSRCAALRSGRWRVVPSWKGFFSATE
ncbi:geranylgeranyl pyrophosphate synthetase [Rhypophila decipiens]|uniref:Geranylgeranyl pyrophosphate synthetase n=1 Tax=Rhypophila decipiens TaxID=261697 RepID=A0AAN6XSJ8_9PEZI|nr:geranylgeranyl pyrophosphate synthetase [Rhypophila decipiens]